LPDTETAILRKEIADLHGVVSEVKARNAELAARVADLEARNRELEARLAHCENPYSPPSRGSIPSQQRKRARSARGGSRSPAPSGAGRPGRRAGRRGVSSERRADRTVRHGVPDRCPGCGGACMRETRITTKMVTDRVRTQVRHHGARGGMRMFGTIMTCLGTWRMGGLDVAEKLREVLAAA